MKNWILAILIFIGLGVSLILPVTGYIALNDTGINNEEALRDSSKENNHQSDMAEIAENEKNEDNDLVNTKDALLEENEISTIAEEIVPLGSNNFQNEKEVQKKDNEDNDTFEEKKDNINDEMNDDTIIVTGLSVKESFKFHINRIKTEELMFRIVDKYENVSYYYEYDVLNADVLDETNYKKEFELNSNGELIKYIYTEVK